MGVVLAAGAKCLAQADSATYNGRTVAQWTADLADLESPGSEDKRRRAAYALGQIGPAAKGAVPALVKVVRDPYMEPRWYAVDALGRIGGGAPAAEAVAGAIRDKENDVYVRRGAVRALGQLGSAAQDQVDLLTEQLASPDAATQAGAALALWQIARRPEALTTLRSMLSSSTPDAAFQACMALLEMESAARPALPELVAALSNKNADVRRAATKVLGGLGIEAARALQAEIARSDDRTDAAAAAAALGLINERVRTQILYQGGTTAKSFDDAAGALRKIILPPLLGLLASPDENVRRESARALARLGPLAVPELLTALQSENADARAGAADALARMERYLPAESPGPANIERLKQDLVDPLAAAMREPRFETRYAAVRATAALAFGPSAAKLAPLLSTALEDEDAGIRRYAAQALREIERKPSS